MRCQSCENKSTNYEEACSLISSFLNANNLKSVFMAARLQVSEYTQAQYQYAVRTDWMSEE